MTEAQRLLRVRISASAGGDGQAVDCALDGHKGTTVAEFINLGVEAGLWQPPRGRWIAQVQRSGMTAGPDDTIRILKLRDGDTLSVSGADRTVVIDPTPVPASGDQLLVTGGPSAGRRLPLGDDTVTVGRDAPSTLRLDDPSLSGVHFELRRAPAGWMVTDQGSRNGTSLGGRTLKPNVPALLPNGFAQIEAGRTVLELRQATALAPIEVVASEHGRIGVNPRAARDACAARRGDRRARGPRKPKGATHAVDRRDRAADRRHRAVADPRSDHVPGVHVALAGDADRHLRLRSREWPHRVPQGQ